MLKDNEQSSSSIDLVFKIIITVVFSCLLIVVTGEICDAINVQFGIEQLVMTIFAGLFSSYRLLHGL